MPSAFVDALRHIGHDWWCAEVVRQWDNFFGAMQ
jgi:hypothetical protein